MQQPSIYSATLGLSHPWQVTGISFAKDGKKDLDITVHYADDAGLHLSHLRDNWGTLRHAGGDVVPRQFLQVCNIFARPCAAASLLLLRAFTCRAALVKIGVKIHTGLLIFVDGFFTQLDVKSASHLPNFC